MNLKYDYMNLVDFIRSNILINNTTTIKSITKKATPEIRKTENNLKKDEEQLKSDHEKFEKEKQITKIVENIDVIRLNVSNEMMMATRETITRIPKSILSMIFNAVNENRN
jgi:hypothetical protein